MVKSIELAKYATTRLVDDIQSGQPKGNQSKVGRPRRLCWDWSIRWSYYEGCVGTKYFLGDLSL